MNYIKWIIVIFSIVFVLSCVPGYQRHFDAICAGTPDESLKFIKTIIEKYGYSLKENKNIYKYKDLIAGAVFEQNKQKVSNSIGVAVIYRSKDKKKIEVCFSVFIDCRNKECRSVVDNEFEKLTDKIESNIELAKITMIQKH